MVVRIINIDIMPSTMTTMKLMKTRRKKSTPLSVSLSLGETFRLIQ